MKAYTFRVLLEKSKWPDEPEEKAIWCASVPALIEKGVATHGKTQAEAIHNLQEVLEMVVESMIEHGEIIPLESPEVDIYPDPRVVINA